MNKPLIVVTGMNGQLGWSLQQIAQDYKEYQFLFVDRTILDLSNPETIAPFFKLYQPNYFINCAAYTAVDKAETEQEQALQINAISVGKIAQQCAAINAIFITISTDYVFDGNGVEPYTTQQPTNPINYYGYSKMLGEQLALHNHNKTIVIRTSWVYCEHGNNFVKTMLRLMKERTTINVVNDQKGCPTYAPNLAKAILQIIDELQKGNEHFGIYHFSNAPMITWFEFAQTIKTLSALSCTVNPITTADFPTPAKRPFYSVMDTTKITQDFKVEMINWQDSLLVCLQHL